MKQEIFLKLSRKIHKIYILVCFMQQYFADDIEEACNEVNVEELHEFNEITPHGFTLDEITQELKNLKLAPVMWMDGEDTVVTL